MLEENSFRGHTADFVVMFLFGSVSMIIFAFFVNLLFLGKGVVVIKYRGNLVHYARTMPIIELTLLFS